MSRCPTDGRARWLAQVRDALVRAAALVEEARIAGRDTSDAERRIAIALDSLDNIEAGRDREGGDVQ